MIEVFMILRFPLDVFAAVPIFST
uniref:Uncharacterized protein n=1 Tax=Anguilla anguilla TaxID=7936 RepID=A0A0E9P5D6_ANGAN